MAIQLPLLSDSLLSDREAGQLAGQSPRTIRRWRKTGVLPFYMAAKGARIRKADLDAFLESHRVETTIAPAGNYVKLLLNQISDRVLRDMRKTR